MPDTIQVGDVVELKGGIGIEMVVETINADIARCVWFDCKENVLKHDDVYVVALRKPDE